LVIILDPEHRVGRLGLDARRPQDPFSTENGLGDHSEHTKGTLVELERVFMMVTTIAAFMTTLFVNMMVELFDGAPDRPTAQHGATRCSASSQPAIAILYLIQNYPDSYCEVCMLPEPVNMPG